MKYAALSFIAHAGAHVLWSAGAAAAETPAIRPSEVADFRLLYRAELLGMPRRGWTGSIDRRNRQPRVPRHRRRCHDPPRRSRRAGLEPRCRLSRRKPAAC